MKQQQNMFDYFLMEVTFVLFTSRESDMWGIQY